MPRPFSFSKLTRQKNPLCWLKINDHESLGLGEEHLDQVMIKPLADRRWPPGLVDLLGYQF